MTDAGKRNSYDYQLFTAISDHTFFFVGASISFIRRSLTTSTHPSPSITCFRYSFIPLTSTLHSKSRRLNTVSSVLCISLRFRLPSNTFYRMRNEKTNLRFFKSYSERKNAVCDLQAAQFYSRFIIFFLAELSLLIVCPDNQPKSLFLFFCQSSPSVKQFFKFRRNFN